MIENTSENKAKFFTQYWGQSISGFKKGSDTLRFAKERPEFFIHQNFLNGAILNLRTLSNLTDEDANGISELTQLWEGNILPVEDVSEWLDEILTGNCATSADYVSAYEASQVIDYLRSKGYALPWMGLSVEQQIEYGWVRLLTT